MGQQVNKDQITTEEIDLVLGSDWSGFSGHSVSAVRVGKTVFLRGLLTKSSSWVSGELAASIPEGFRPSSRMAEANIIFHQPHNTSSTLQSGTLNVYAASAGGANHGDISTRIAGAAGNYISLYGINYEVE